MKLPRGCGASADSRTAPVKPGYGQGRCHWSEDDESFRETAYLLRSQENAQCLVIAIDRLENGGGAVRDPVE
ncbi:hypothetical protein FRACA_340027 [Frankia canadensis]|uniref:Uncharacterized protein n=1 Tax=Frankia canadensis TaxID=1836972 RepID=A0A2I2KV26_9ACTN|nr:hypothetical protein FRACA_340027 [Frankia canadensis]SOU56807.1 hypothetical protein FRACA_340027 [Frankia canadensis]